ncbi:MAG TPA: hypothetical protein DCM08_03170 [Microscillaceae bacterium]|nr:hypothetical protein [Microscillaceae bacterium]
MITKLLLPLSLWVICFLSQNEVFCQETTQSIPKQRIISLNHYLLNVGFVHSLNYEKIVFTKNAWQVGVQVGLGWGIYYQPIIFNINFAQMRPDNRWILPVAVVLSWGKRASKLDLIAEYLFYYARPSQYTAFVAPYDHFSNTLQAGIGWRLQPLRGGFFVNASLKTVLLNAETVSPAGNNGKEGWRFGYLTNGNSTQITITAQIKLGVGWVFPYAKKSKLSKE